MPNKEDDVLPVGITLGKTKLVFTDNGWVLGTYSGCSATSPPRKASGGIQLDKGFVGVTNKPREPVGRTEEIVASPPGPFQDR